MGNNYFIHEERCPHCGHYPTLEHIGKASHGWKFQFNGSVCKTKADWEARLLNCAIIDEDNRFISHQAFFDMVDRKQDGLDHTTASSKQWGIFPPDKRTYLDDEGYYFFDGDFC